ncbi:MAG TPA: DJ-1/PfpI family protein [Candidatus Bathyarchaeia archaeon]|nr:DJ-1/PfpI family protein [Candidatus Bathyarchaeia archaeon]
MASEHPTVITIRPSHGTPTNVYSCPPCGQECDKIKFDKPGNCPHCGMKLVPLGSGWDSPPVVAILLFNGAQIIDFAGPWEVFGTAGFLVHTVAKSQEPLTMVFGQKIVADYTFENSPKADILLIPGGGVGAAMDDPRLIQWIQAKAKDVSHIMSVCTGAFLLGKAGLLAGQTATATYGMVDDLLTFPNTRVVHDQRYVDNGKVITAAGLTSGIDAALHLVSKMRGRGEAQSVALGMEYHWDPDSKYARGALADRYLPDGLAFGNASLKGAQAEMISTDGDTDHWEAKILVSEPSSLTGIMNLLHDRVASNIASAGMSNRISHIQGKVSLGRVRPNDSEISWKFKDDRGDGWSGLGVVESATDHENKFVVTLKLTRQKVAR